VAVITVFSGAFSGGDKVAEAVAARLGYEFVGADLLDVVADRFNVAKNRLARTMEGPPPFLSKLTHERERNMAYLRAAMADLVLKDNVVYHGLAGHLVPREISHVLQVCVIANLDHRVAVAMKQTELSEKQAVKQIHKEDGQCLRWTRDVRDSEPYDERLYDLLLAMQSASVDSAAESICEIVLGEELKTTSESRRAAEEFRLATQVEIALAPLGYVVDVTCTQGDVTVALNRYVSRLAAVKQEVESVVAGVPGVNSACCVPGSGFVPPSLLGLDDEFERPPKILLVDDEREFVHTLSERLQARDLEAAIAYDGEEALSILEADEPEVMVLDLKMPGIDGIEVLRRVKRDYPKVEVIILTGHGSKKEETLAQELGAFAYLRKPVEIDLLTKTMKEAYRKIDKPHRLKSQTPEE
jgi:two-component system response regulator CpxR